MPTATKTKQKTTSALELVHEKEAAWNAAEAEANTEGRKLGDLVQRSRHLHDQRRLLAHREPELVDHLGNAVDKAGPIAELDRAIGELGDLGEQQAKSDHARRLAARAKQSWKDTLAAHLPEVVEDLPRRASA